MSPTFSIIIPVYNVAPYLRECLDSVLAQTYTDWEAICVDDGSTDGSGEILDEYAKEDKRFRVLHQKNAGSSAARNVGLDNATGKWIWFIDADDFINNTAMFEFMQIRDKADVTFFGMRVIFADGFMEDKHPSLSGPFSSDKEIDSLIKLLYQGHLGDIFGWTVNKIILRDVVENNHIRFNESISFYEDEVFAIRVMECVNTLSTIPNVFYNYRILNSGLTAKGIPEPYLLASAFYHAGSTLRRKSLSQLVDMRVTMLLRPLIHKRCSFKAAQLLLKEKKMYSPCIELQGRLNHFIKILIKLPISLASCILVFFLLIKK